MERVGIRLAGCAPVVADASLWMRGNGTSPDVKTNPVVDSRWGDVNRIVRIGGHGNDLCFMRFIG